MSSQNSAERARVALVACMDTKGAEAGFVKDFLEGLGFEVISIDIGVGNKPGLEPAITRDEVAKAAGHHDMEWDSLSKNERLDIMAQGLTAILVELHRRSVIQGVFALGGGQGTMMVVRGIKELPVGIPKVLLSVVASGQRRFEPFVGTKDVTVIHSVVDLCGLNPVSRMILRNAAAALAGAVRFGQRQLEDHRPLIAATMLGVTTPGVARTIRSLESAGHEVVVFHASGVGGRAMDEMIGNGVIGAVMDLTPHEIVGELFGGSAIGTKDRLLTASLAGIPQVVAPGGLDFIDFTAGDPAEFDWKARKHHFHNELFIHVKLTKDEISRVAGTVADRLNRARAPVSLIIPLKGFCEAARPGGPLYDPEVDQAFIATLKTRLSRAVKWVEVDANINDPAFSTAVFEETTRLLKILEGNLNAG